MPEYNPLEPILIYELTEMEAKAFKVSLMWEVLSRREFPNYQHGRIRKKGDPRKTSLFKYCLKLIQETNGIIPDAEYKLYVTAQLRVLKECTDGTVHALIHPQCLVGIKAWRRWSMWKRNYDKEKKALENQLTVDPTASEKVKEQLRMTKKFFTKMCDGIPDGPKVKCLLKDIVKWVNLDRVSPYYVLLSTHVQKAIGKKTIDEVFGFDSGVYRPDITEDVRNYFLKEFECPTIP